MNREKIETIIVIVVIILVILGIKPAIDTVHSQEISNGQYYNLIANVSNNCPELKPIVALYVKEYKFISIAKYYSFNIDCEAIHNTYIKKELIREVSEDE